MLHGTPSHALHFGAAPFAGVLAAPVIAGLSLLVSVGGTVSCLFLVDACDDMLLCFNTNFLQHHHYESRVSQKRITCRILGCVDLLNVRLPGPYPYTYNRPLYMQLQ